MVSTIAPSLATWRLAAQSLGAPLVLQDNSWGKGQYRRQAGVGIAFLPVGRGQGCSAAATAVVCSLFVAASARCKPPKGGSVTRSLRFECSIARSRCKRRNGKRGSGMPGEGGDWANDAWDGNLWSGGDGIGDGGSGSNGGGGSGWGADGSGDDAFHKTVFECMWLWQLICGVSMLQTCYFMLFQHQDIWRFGPHAGPTNIMPTRVAVTC